MKRATLILVALFPHFLGSVQSLQFASSFACTSAPRMGFLTPAGSRTFSSRMILPRTDRNALFSGPDATIEGSMNENDDKLTSLKVELAAYLQKRKEVGADELAQE
jgi:hypothetical protein